MTDITIAGLSIPAYGFWGVLGAVLGIAVLAALCRAMHKSFDDAVFIYVWAAVSAIIGAKLLYIAVEIRHIAEDLGNYPPSQVLAKYLGGGFVFYGGLFGALLGTYLASRYFKKDFREQLNLSAPVLPFAHGFGRIGCHITGCCFGKAHSGAFSVVYHHSDYAPAGVPLFPVQLCESAFDFLLFAALITYVLKKKTLKNVFLYYIAAYAACRFCLEFMRGDKYRGIIAGLSVSQWISVLLLAFVVIILLRRKSAYKKHKI